MYPRPGVYPGVETIPGPGDRTFGDGRWAGACAVETAGWHSIIAAGRGRARIEGGRARASPERLVIMDKMTSLLRP